MYWFRTVSNKPRLRDPTTARQIINKYWFDYDLSVGVQRGRSGRHRLVIKGDGWPGAWPLPPDTVAELYVPDFDTNGLDEFDEFLAEIAPVLAELLIIQAIGTTCGRFPLSACEWRIEPGSSTIDKFEFTSSAPTPVLAAAV